MGDGSDDDDTPPRQRRPGSQPAIWDDDRRAGVGKEHRRTAPRGIPVVAERDRSEFTPVTDLLDFIDDPKLRHVARRIWEHTANLEMRFNQRLGTETDVEEIKRELIGLSNEHHELRVDLTGRDGTNGKVGAIKSSLDKLLGRAWWLISLAVGAIGAAAVKLILVGVAYGHMETELAAMQDRVQLLESVTFLRNRVAPALTAPGKDPP